MSSVSRLLQLLVHALVSLCTWGGMARGGGQVARGGGYDQFHKLPQ